MAEAIGLNSGLRVINNTQLIEQERRAAEEQAAAESEPNMDDLAGYIRSEFEMMQTHRNSQNGWSTRLLNALRMFNGEYTPEQIQDIKKFGGSEVYARLVAMKCRGASALLRDVYLSSDKAWGVDPPADPDVPEGIIQTIQQLVQSELAAIQMQGTPVDPGAIRDRMLQLMEAARNAEKKQAAKRAKIAEEKIDEILTEGGFYNALAEFLVDLPLFPFACIKGPVVRITPKVKWDAGKPIPVQEPKMTWQRISPFDLFWTPGVARIADAAVIERQRLTRAELNDLLDLPGYDTDAIRKVLDEYGRGGLFDNWDTTDSDRAVQENRENPNLNRSGLINCLAFYGNVQGRLLREYGWGKDKVPDELRDYAIEAWLIGRHVIKVQFSPSPRKRHPYYITSFEKVPGTPVGNALPDILSDLQDVSNATLRALVNNMAISSGPQVVINDDRLAAEEDGEDLYPWKRWHTLSDPMGNNTQLPISFFQPNANANELLLVYKQFNEMADELSAIPKYLSGQSAGGAGRTASGLAMLMGNASKLLQTVAANIDLDVIDPCLTALADMIMLTDTLGILQGDEAINVKGVVVAIQRETERSRQLEFLQITANPLDSQIIGPRGRAAILRSVSSTIGIDGDKVVPTDDEIEKLMQMQAQQSQQEAAAQAQGSQSGGSAVQGGQGPRTSITPSSGAGTAT